MKSFYYKGRLIEYIGGYYVYDGCQFLLKSEAKEYIDKRSEI